MNGLTSLAVTKLDVLSAFAELPVCVALPAARRHRDERLPRAPERLPPRDARVRDAARLGGAARRARPTRRAARRRARATSRSSRTRSASRSAWSGPAPTASACSRRATLESVAAPALDARARLASPHDVRQPTQPPAPSRPASRDRRRPGEARRGPSRRVLATESSCRRRTRRTGSTSRRCRRASTPARNAWTGCPTAAPALNQAGRGGRRAAALRRRRLPRPRRSRARAVLVLRGGSLVARRSAARLERGAGRRRRRRTRRWSSRAALGPPGSPSGGARRSTLQRGRWR